MTDLGHWETSAILTEDSYGFIYEIINLVSGRKYIGKKQMISIKKMPPLKGKKNKRHKKIETDWKDYCSSSNELQADINKLGKDKFKFIILQFCNSKWELAYFETKLQFERQVLISEEYYNGIINCRIGKKPKL